MSRIVRVSEFSAASAAYADAAVKKANTNGNGFLTKTEAAALPKDLKDNYEQFRSGDSRGIASAAGFTRDYARTVAAAAERADVNGDGVLSVTELHNLPAELQDNVSNYARVTLKAPQTVAELSLPLSKANVELVRKALTSWVENALTPRKVDAYGDYEYANGDWAKLVHESGGDSEHAGLKRDALKMAKSWKPDADWQADTNSRGGVYFTGNFEMITLFVQLEKGKAPSFASEVC